MSGNQACFLGTLDFEYIEETKDKIKKSSEKTFGTPCKIPRESQESLGILQGVPKVSSEDFLILSLVSSIYPKWSVPRNQAWFPDTTGTDSLKICSFVDNSRETRVTDSPGILKCVWDSPGISLGKVD